MNSKTPSRTGPLAPFRLWQLSLLATALILMALLTADGTAGAAGTGGPAAPANLQAAPGNGIAALTWDTSNDVAISNYQYRIREGVGTELKDWVTFGSEATTSHTISGLTNGMDYEIHLRAVYDGTAGPYSIVHTVPFLDPPARPKKLTAARGADGITISWKKSKDGSITRYETRWARKGEEIVLKEWNSVGMATSAKITMTAPNTAASGRYR